MPDPFRLDLDDTAGKTHPLKSVAKPAVARVLRLKKLNAIYRHVKAQEAANHDTRPFADQALDALHTSVALPIDHLDRIPKTGPLVVVANHPFGGVEGLALMSLLMRVRPDVKLLVNQILGMIPDLRPNIFTVDVFGGKDAVRNNATAVREAVQYVSDGHCLGMFPSGTVSHLRLRKRCVVDPEWVSTAARILQRTGASATCVYFDGRNSNLFQLAGLVHPMLRTALLPREMLKRRGGKLTVRVSQPLSAERLARFADRDRLTDYLRVRTYLLKPGRPETTNLPDHAVVNGSPIAEPADPDKVAAELLALPAHQRLLTSGDYDVLYIYARQADAVMHEIGRLRELAFRAVGEGTGTSRDLDRYDKHYLHLVLWRRDQCKIAGSYRMGLTDQLLAKQGTAGLYTATLFDYKESLFKSIGPSIELGRSFVHPDEQRSYLPLQLLWKGIGHFAVLHPHYRNLFGPVSISARYTDMSKVLLAKFCELHRGLKRDDLPKPKNPHRHRVPKDVDKKMLSTVVANLDEVNDLVGELEADGKTMPVLLRQYLKLNGKLLGFNVDPDFGDVLDGLLLVDMTNIPRAILSRYMTKDGYAHFMKHHAEKGAEGLRGQSPEAHAAKLRGVSNCRDHGSGINHSTP